MNQKKSFKSLKKFPEIAYKLKKKNNLEIENLKNLLKSFHI